MWSLVLGSLGPQGEDTGDKHECCNERPYLRCNEASGHLVTFKNKNVRPAMLPVDPCDNFRARNPQKLFVSATKVFPTQLYVFHLKLSWMYIYRYAYIVRSHKVGGIIQ